VVEFKSSSWTRILLGFRKSHRIHAGGYDTHNTRCQSRSLQRAAWLLSENHATEPIAGFTVQCTGCYPRGIQFKDFMCEMNNCPPRSSLLPREKENGPPRIDSAGTSDCHEALSEPDRKAKVATESNE
jgi:hypothetical protein